MLDINTVIHTKTALPLTVILGISLPLNQHMNIVTAMPALLRPAFIYDKLELISYITKNTVRLQYTEKPTLLRQGNNRCLF
jgi:hypothetical protein